CGALDTRRTDPRRASAGGRTSTTLGRATRGRIFVPMQYSLRHSIMIAAACGLGVAPALAAEPGSTPSLQQVTVTAQKEFYRGDTPLEELPQAVDVVSGNLLKVEGITRLDDALTLVSGTAQQNNFGGLWDAYAIRGFAGNENLPSGYLVNGFNWGRG